RPSGSGPLGRPAQYASDAGLVPISGRLPTAKVAPRRSLNGPGIGAPDGRSCPRPRRGLDISADYGEIRVNKDGQDGILTRPDRVTRRRLNDRMNEPRPSFELLTGSL